MDAELLLLELESDWPSVEALHEAQRRPEAVQAAVVAMVEEVARGVLPVPRQENLLRNGIAVLAAARRTELYRPLLRLCRLPTHVIDFVFGDRASEFLGRAVVSTFDGDPDPLIDVVMDFTSDGFVRWSLMSALARFVFDGRIPQAQAVAVIDRFEAERTGRERSAAWLGWASMIMLLGLRDHADRIRAAWEDGRIVEPTEELDEWLADLEAAAADPTNPARFEHERAMPIDDPMDILRLPPADDDLDEDDDQLERSVDPADLADDIEPTPAEEGWLSIFLDDRPVMRGDVGFELVDGFFSGIANGPATIETAECLSMLRRFIKLDDGDFASEEQQRYCMDLIERLWLAITLRAQHGVPHVPPFDPSDDVDAGRSWAAGFLAAVATDSAAWRPLVERRSHLPYLQLMVALADGSLEELARKEPMPKREDFLIRLPTIVMEIAAFWRRRRERETPPVRVAKVGRNDPCPCGSGRKFKRCCGA